MKIWYHSANKAPNESIGSIVSDIQKTSKELSISPLLNPENVLKRIENDIDVSLKHLPEIRKQLKLKQLTFGRQTHIDLILDTKERSAVLITLVFQKGGDA